MGRDYFDGVYGTCGDALNALLVRTEIKQFPRSKVKTRQRILYMVDNGETILSQ